MAQTGDPDGNGTGGSGKNLKAFKFLPDPPVPFPSGSPVCAINPSITLWKIIPS